MRLAIVILPIVCSLCLNVHAQETKWPSSITLPSGKSYTGIVSVKPVGNGIRIIHQDGAATISYQDIAEKDRTAFGYDPAKVAEADKRDAAHEAAVARQQVDDQSTAARKQSALDELRKSLYGGSYYRQAAQSYRSNKDAEALKKLIAAGFTEFEAKSAMAAIREKETAKPNPPIHPEFLRPQGQLRGSPSIDWKKKGSVKK